ncbi:MAG: 2Fe-2S ferredoxin [Arthrobacter sp.]|jgi:Rieske Fe-S protein|nr:2Fe-2S ferredoxin [Arthrobacter sp.]
MQNGDPVAAAPRSRRAILEVGLGVGLGLASVAKPAGAAVTGDPVKAPPQVGDRLSYMSGPKKGQIVQTADLKVGDQQVMTFPVDPTTSQPRSGSRLNQVLLIRLDPAGLEEEVKNASADGIVAYSAVCTHQGCPVNMYKKDEGVLYCSCHHSEFDPKAGAKVVGGPAPRRLAMLPLKVEDGTIVVAGQFTGRVGFK